jgi:hypothetical protein
MPRYRGASRRRRSRGVMGLFATWVRAWVSPGRNSPPWRSLAKPAPAQPGADGTPRSHDGQRIRKFTGTRSSMPCAVRRARPMCRSGRAVLRPLILLQLRIPSLAVSGLCPVIAWRCRHLSGACCRAVRRLLSSVSSRCSYSVWQTIMRGVEFCRMSTHSWSRFVPHVNPSGAIHRRDVSSWMTLQWPPG